MCGINGIISLGKSLDLNSKISEMNAAIFHRGPDSDGEFVAKENHLLPWVCVGFLSSI